MLFSFIVDVGGGTFCAQVDAQTLNEAIDTYRLTDPAEIGLSEFGKEDPALLHEHKNAWCVTELNTDDEHIIAHVILTDGRDITS